MESPTQPTKVVSVHGQSAEVMTVRLTSSQDQAVALLLSFGRQVAYASGFTWTTTHEDRVRLFVGALVDAAEERLAEAIIELTRDMIADEQRELADEKSD
jgi:hypothetical protein